MKKIFQLILLLCAISTAKAQTFTPPAFADVDNNYRTYVNNVFGALENNRVTTGLLTDYGFDFTDPKIYNGSVLADSTLMEQGIYSELYKTIFTSKFNNNAGTLIHPSEYDSLCYIARQKEVITLSGLLFKYNAIDPNAQTNGKMQTVDGQLKDKYVSGVWQNPYQEYNAVAISPSAIKYNLTYCSVVLPSNLFLTNRSSDISSIQFDAADGQGYRIIQFNTPINLNYSDTGWKHWVFKITLIGGQQLFSHSKVHFNNTSNAAGSGGNVLARGVPDRTGTITATEEFNGVFGIADIVISFRNENDPVLRRPLIIAEGFDPGWITMPEEPEGENTFAGFVGSVRDSRSTDLQNLIADEFDPNAISEYDLVYVNWRNGTDWLQRNAFVLEEVIREVNRLKQPLNGFMQPNVVLGSSMGGVIARMALGRMDRGGGQNGAGGFAAHQTNLYISLDAPHQGANVPLGYQAAARHAARMYVSTGGLSVAVETIQLLRNGPSPLLNLFLADQPAARQMLINRIDINYNQNNTPNQQFLEELRTQWAYPLNIRNIAISNGSECAIDQEFAAGSSLLYHFRSTKTRFIGDLIFMAAGAGLAYLNTPAIITIPLILPGSSKFELTLDIKSIANGGGNAVYYGNIKLTKKVLWLVSVSINIANKTYNAPTGILPFDTYPGGFYTLFLDNQPGSVSQDWMFSYNNSFFIQRRFSFIPTTSSLDIGLGNTALTNANYLARYIGATPPTAPFNTPFANFTTAFNEDGSDWNFDNNNFRRINNEPHEGFFLRTANWLAQELNGIPGTSCVGVCNNLSISGDNSFCTTSTTYTIPDLPAGANVTWSATPSGAVGLSCNPCSTVILTRNYDATLNLTASITNACGDPVVINKNNVVAGFPFYAGPMGADTAWPNGNYYYYAHLPLGYPPATDYSWTVPSGWSILSGQGTNTLYVRTGTTGGAVEVDITACDISRPTYKYVEIGSGTWWPDGGGGDVYMLQSTSLSPNPADNFVTISVKSNNKLIKTGKEKNASFNAVTIYDITGAVKKRLQYGIGTKQAQVNVSDLRPGTYIVEITDGHQTEIQQLIIQKK